MKLDHGSTVLFALLTAVVSVAGCGSGSEKSNWPYEFISSKSERTGYYNVMDLYAFSCEFDAHNLRAFCRNRLEESDAEAFYYVVVFDEADNAGFPSYPLTAGFSQDEKLAKHIRAICEFNKVNGFAELRHYDDNLWESVSKVENL
jgi:hypothetical protein